jgi:hypothetical protein
MDVSNIAMLPVESSQIHSIGHDPVANVLAIRFKDRATGGPTSLYAYRNFTAEDFKAFREAESIGSHFYKHIKPEVLKFPYQKIDQAAQKAA